MAATWNGDKDHRTISIPWFNISRVRHLTLEASDHYMGAIPDGLCLPPLRSLTFNNCSLLERDWVAQLLRRLKDEGNVPQLTVTDCRWRHMDRHNPLEDVGENSESDSDDSDNSDDSDDSDGPPSFITADEMLSLIP